jgi:catechol 2,3-dioxygenase-like lactoylglutathione lyase family enzyme
MSTYQLAVPVLQVANVESSVRWYGEVLGFKADTFPKTPPYSFAILRRDGAEIMLQGAHESPAASPSKRAADPEFRWSVSRFAIRTDIGSVSAATLPWVQK